MVFGENRNIPAFKFGTTTAGRNFPAFDISFCFFVGRNDISWKLTEKQNNLFGCRLESDSYLNFGEQNYLISECSITCQQYGQSARSPTRSNCSPIFGAILWFWTRMIVNAFGLEKYCVAGGAPEMCYWIAAVTATRTNIQFTSVTSTRIGTRKN